MSTAAWQLARADEEVVPEPASLDGREPASNVSPTQPVRIALVVDLVPDADEAVAAGTAHQRVEIVADRGGREVDPANDAPDEVLLGCEREEAARLVEARDRLDKDRPGDTRGPRAPVRGPPGPKGLRIGASSSPTSHG